MVKIKEVKINILRDFMNFSETFRKNVTYDDNIKSDQKTMLYSLQTVIFFFEIYF